MDKIIRVCVIAALLTTFGITAVFADDDFQPTRVNIPVTYDAGANEEKATFVLSASDVDAPMPEDSTERSKIVVMKKGGVVDFGSITFQRPDAFMYSIDRKEQSPDIDATHYDVFVAVLANGQKVLVIKKEGQKKKTDKICYKDRKLATTFGISPKTGDFIRMLPYLVTLFMALIAGGLLLATKRDWDNEFKRLLKK